jgi:hypothetical protein
VTKTNRPTERQTAPPRPAPRRVAPPLLFQFGPRVHQLLLERLHLPLQLRALCRRRGRVTGGAGGAGAVGARLLCGAAQELLGLGLELGQLVCIVLWGWGKGGWDEGLGWVGPG